MIPDCDNNRVPDTTPCGSTSICDPIDFNNNGVFPDSQDLDDYLDAVSGNSCGSCNDIDFNNDFISPDSADIDAFLRVFGGGSC